MTSIERLRTRVAVERERRRRAGDRISTYEAYRDEPVGFQEKELGRILWAKQVEVCEAVLESPITVIPAGRAVGKSFLLAGLVLWWVYSRPDSLVITTGPDHRQVVSVLWKEIRRAIRQHAKLDPAHRFPLDHLTEGYSSPQRLTVREETSWGALGFAAKTEEGFSGQHTGELLVIVDEASGITEPIWNAIHALAASRLVVCGNPVRYDSHFRELNDLARAGSTSIRSIRISGLDHPHATLDHSPVGAVSRSFLDQMREIHGENSPWWNSNILGLFPGAESVAFIPREWIDACADPAILDDEPWRDYPEGPACLAVDVGGGVGADRSTVVVRNRKRILEVFASEWHGVLDDARHRLEPVVADLARKWSVIPERIIYDKGGIGRSFGSYLANHGLPGAVGYFGAGRGGPYYLNRRTACAFAIKRRLDPHRDGHAPFYCGGLAEWPALRQELSELRSPTMTLDEGVVKEAIEDKQSLMARLHRSPDLLDAFLMTFTFVD